MDQAGEGRRSDANLRSIQDEDPDLFEGNLGHLVAALLNAERIMPYGELRW